MPPAETPPFMAQADDDDDDDDEEDEEVSYFS
jgi:hypothetical protein